MIAKYSVSVAKHQMQCKFDIYLNFPWFKKIQLSINAPRISIALDSESIHFDYTIEISLKL